MAHLIRRNIVLCDFALIDEQLFLQVMVDLLHFFKARGELAVLLIHALVENLELYQFFLLSFQLAQSVSLGLNSLH